MSELPIPRTSEGRAGLAAIVREPDTALIALDFDGTVSPIVRDPRAARAHPGAVPALSRLAPAVGTLVVITGRSADAVVEYGGFAGIPGLVVLGNYGWDRWEDGRLTAPPIPPELAEARAQLPGIVAGVGGAEGTWTEDKNHGLAVHTRRAADPRAAMEGLSGPIAELASRTGLVMQLGRLVIELRPEGTDKGAALRGLAAERDPGSVMFCGDDLGDLAAFAAVREMRADGVPGLTVYSNSSESATALTAEADLVVDGPDGVIALLAGIADAVGGTRG
jgi:trehalose 6-phosphate phosphatase